MRKLLRCDLNTQVTAGYHDSVAGLDDLVKVLKSLSVLDLCDDSHRGAALI